MALIVTRSSDRASRFDIWNCLATQYGVVVREEEVVRQSVLLARHETWVINSVPRLFVKADFHGCRGIAHEALLLAKLGGLGARVPQLVPTKFGEEVFVGDNFELFVAKFVDGRGLVCSESDYRLLGSALAELHGFLDSNEERLSVETIDVASMARAARDRLLTGGIDEVLGQVIVAAFAIVELAIEGSSFAFDSVGICHGDPHPGNVVLDASCSVRWTDWEDACRTSRIMDLGAVVWSTFGHQMTRQYWTAAIAGYSAVARVPSNLGLAVGAALGLRQLWWLSLHVETWKRRGISAVNNDFLWHGARLLTDICVQVVPSRFHGAYAERLRKLTELRKA